MFYERIYIVKPNTSRYANSEKYVVCMDFTDNITQSIKYKFWSTLKILNNIDFNEYNIDSFLNINHNLHFLNSLEEINIILGQRQIENILFTIKVSTLLDMCLSSLNMGHSNLLCIGAMVDSFTALTETIFVTVSMLMSRSPKNDPDPQQRCCHKVARTEILCRMRRSRAP